MKKAFLFMAAALTLAAFSCKKPANGTDEQNPGAQVTVAARPTSSSTSPRTMLSPSWRA